MACRLRAFVGASPRRLMHAWMSGMGVAAIAAASGASANSVGVASFTALSVVWALSST